MDYTIAYHAEIPEDLSSVPENIKTRIRRAIERRLLKDPLKFGDPLRRSLQGYRKLRVGDYRVIYRIQDTDIFVLKIGHRKDVYKKHPESRNQKPK